ncbi:MAG: putative holin-like toxin [Tumebacillaceae bacterium]
MMTESESLMVMIAFGTLIATIVIGLVTIMIMLIKKK